MAPTEGVPMALDVLAPSSLLVVPSVFLAIAAPVSPKAEVNAAEGSLLRGFDV
jgi:hypothetical protein